MVNKWKTSNVDKDVEMSDPVEQVEVEQEVPEATYSEWVKVAARDIVGACIGFDKDMNGVLNDIATTINNVTKE